MKTSFLLTACFAAALAAALPSRAQEPAPAPDAADELVLVQHPGADINQLLEQYELYSGKILIRDATIAALPQPIKLDVKEKMPRSQAARLIESVLLLNGYALVPGDDNTVKVINTQAGKNPRSEGVPVFASLADLPKGDQVVAFFMPFRYLSANEAMPIFQQHFPSMPQYGGIVPVPNAQALVLTDKASAIRQLVKLKELVDVPPARVLSEFVALQRADAERVAETLNKLIESRRTKTLQQGGGQPGAPAAQEGVPAGPNERNLIAGDVELVPDARTNRILVITRPVNFDYIRNLILEFDQAVTLTSPYEHKLNYVTAAEVLPVLQTLLLEDKDDKSGAASQANRPGQNNNNSETNNGSNSRSDSRSGSSGGSRAASRSLADNENTEPEAISIGKTRIIADNKANSILVIGPPESVDKTREILDRLDKQPLQVYLSTVIGQLTLGDSTELAVDILQKYEKNGDFGAASSLRTRSGDADIILDPESLISPEAFTSLATGATVYGVIGSTIDYYVKALASTNRFKVISRPAVYTANNKAALIASGQRIAVPSSTLSSLDGSGASDGSVVSNIEYTDVELSLDIRPLINANRDVTLRIKQVNDSVVGNQVISGNSIPTIGTQTLDTTVTVPNRGTIVLGGLITEDANTGVTGIPLLKDIPLLGYLFKGTTKSKNRSELIVMVQAVVVGDMPEMIKASQEEVDRNRIGPEAKAYSDGVPYDPKKKKKPQKPPRAPAAVPAEEPAPAPPTLTNPPLEKEES
jgi:type II secretion system protein D